MKKITKSIITIVITIIILSTVYFGYTEYKKGKKYEKAALDIIKTGYNMSIKYNSDVWEVGIGEGVVDEEYYAGFTIKSRKNKSVLIDITYQKDLHEYTKEELEYGSDTGGYEDHGEAILYNISERVGEYEKVRTIRGQELYIEKDRSFAKHSISLLQMVGDNVTESMGLLNKNPNKLIPRQSLLISGRFRNHDEDLVDDNLTVQEYRDFKKEFIEIVKSIKITEIEK